MTGKPREMLHVVHLRCQQCNHYHYNTCNLGMVVIITTLYLNDPLEERVVQRLSIGARTPFGLRYAPTTSEQLRLLNTTNYSLDTQQLEQSQENENGMETLELDTPSETVSILESMPPLEGMSANSQDWE